MSSVAAWIHSVASETVCVGCVSYDVSSLSQSVRSKRYASWLSSHENIFTKHELNRQVLHQMYARK